MMCPACETSQFTLIESFFTETFFHRFAYEHNNSFNEAVSGVISIIEKNYCKVYEIYKCKYCGLQFADPMKAGSDSFYNLIYKYMPKSELRWEYQMFKKDFYDGKGRLLDIGCGDGYFINQIRSKDMHAYGIDFRRQGPDIRMNGDDNIQYLDIKNIRDFLSKVTSYDYYTLWQVLEHLEYPTHLLKAISSHAHPNSKLIISVPSDLFYMTHRSQRPVTDYPPHHLTRWTNTALQRIGERCGWILEKHIYEPINKSLILYGKCFAKSILIKRNLLKEVKSFLTTGSFSSNVFSPSYDANLNTSAVKIMGMFIYCLLLCSKSKLTGMSQYAIFKKLSV